MSGNVFISVDKLLLDHDWLADRLIRRSYWGGWLTPEKIQISIENSFCYGLYRATSEDGRQQIGFARVVSDVSTFSSVMDVWVDQAHRRHGLGRLLMNQVIRSPYVAPTISLLYSRDAVGFYEQFGYVHIANGVMKRDPTP